MDKKKKWRDCSHAINFNSTIFHFLSSFQKRKCRRKLKKIRLLFEKRKIEGNRERKERQKGNNKPNEAVGICH